MYTYSFLNSFLLDIICVKNICNQLIRICDQNIQLIFEWNCWGCRFQRYYLYLKVCTMIISCLLWLIDMVAISRFGILYRRKAFLFGNPGWRLLTGISLFMRPANERRRYNVTWSLIGLAHSQNDPWCWSSIIKWMMNNPTSYGKIPAKLLNICAVFLSVIKCSYSYWRMCSLGVAQEWISNFIPHRIMDVTTYPCWDLSPPMLVKETPEVMPLLNKNIIIAR